MAVARAVLHAGARLSPLAASRAVNPSAANVPSPTHIRFGVLAWLCAAAALAYISRNAIAVAESTVRTDLNLTKDQTGMLMSVFFFSYALCQIPTAQLSQRWGSRAALPIFMVISSIATALTAFSGSLWALTITRGFKGIGQAGLFPACTMTIAKWFRKLAAASGLARSAVSCPSAVPSARGSPG